MLRFFSETHQFFREAATREDGRSESGATLIGDKQSGCFSHDMVRGEYSMVRQKAIVTITDKHWPVPWSLVESQLGDLLQWPSSSQGRKYDA